MDLRKEHRAASAVFSGVVAQAGEAELALPTPCAGWTLGELLAHHVGECHGFAASVVNPPGTVDHALWAPVPAEQALADFARSAEEVVDAFAAADPEAQAELRDMGVFPVSTAVLMHLVDCLAHAWDVARTLDLPDPMPPELVEACLPIVGSFPADRPEGGPFGPVVPVPEDASSNHQFLGLLGRDPAWSRGGL